MFSRVTFGTRDLARACAFYDAVLYLRNPDGNKVHLVHRSDVGNRP